MCNLVYRCLKNYTQEERDKIIDGITNDAREALRNFPFPDKVPVILSAIQEGCRIIMNDNNFRNGGISG